MASTATLRDLPERLKTPGHSRATAPQQAPDWRSIDRTAREALRNVDTGLDRDTVRDIVASHRFRAECRKQEGRDKASRSGVLRNGETNDAEQTPGVFLVRNVK